MELLCNVAGLLDYVRAMQYFDALVISGSGGGWFTWIEGGENHGHWQNLQPVGQAEAIVVDFGDVETG